MSPYPSSPPPASSLLHFLDIFFRAVKSDSLCKHGNFGFKLGEQFLKSLFLLLVWSKVFSRHQERRARKQTMDMLGYNASYFHSNTLRMKIWLSSHWLVSSYMGTLHSMVSLPMFDSRSDFDPWAYHLKSECPGHLKQSKAFYIKGWP